MTKGEVIKIVRQEIKKHDERSHKNMSDQVKLAVKSAITKAAIYTTNRLDL